MTFIIKYISILFFITHYVFSATIAPRAINVDLQTELVLDKKNNTSLLRTLDKLLKMITTIENEVTAKTRGYERKRKEWKVVAKINTNNKKHARHEERRPFDDNLSDILKEIKPSVSKDHPFTNFVLTLLADYASPDGANRLQLHGSALLEYIYSYAYRSRVETLGKSFTKFLIECLLYISNGNSLPIETYEQSLQPPHIRKERFNENFNKILDLVDAKFDKNDTRHAQTALTYLNKERSPDTFAKYALEHVILEPFFKFSTVNRKYIRTRLEYLVELGREKDVLKKETVTTLDETTPISSKVFIRKRHHRPIYTWKSKSNDNDELEIKKERKVKLKKHGGLVIKRRTNDFKANNYKDDEEQDDVESSNSFESKKEEIMENFSKIKEGLEKKTLRSNAKIKLQQIDEHWHRIRNLFQDYISKLDE